MSAAWDKFLLDEELRLKALNRQKLASINPDLTRKEIEEEVHLLWENWRLALLAKRNAGEVDAGRVANKRK